MRIGVWMRRADVLWMKELEISMACECWDCGVCAEVSREENIGAWRLAGWNDWGKWYLVKSRKRKTRWLNWANGCGEREHVWTKGAEGAIDCLGWLLQNVGRLGRLVRLVRFEVAACLGRADPGRTRDRAKTLRWRDRLMKGGSASRSRSLSGLRC